MSYKPQRFVTRQNLLALCGDLEIPLLDIQRIVEAYGEERQQGVFVYTEDLELILDFLSESFVNDHLTAIQATIVSWAGQEFPIGKKPIDSRTLRLIKYAVDGRD